MGQNAGGIQICTECAGPQGKQSPDADHHQGLLHNTAGIQAASQECQHDVHGKGSLWHPKQYHNNACRSRVPRGELTDNCKEPGDGLAHHPVYVHCYASKVAHSLRELFDPGPKPPQPDGPTRTDDGPVKGVLFITTNSEAVPKTTQTHQKAKCPIPRTIGNIQS